MMTAKTISFQNLNFKIIFFVFTVLMSGFLSSCKLEESQKPTEVEPGKVFRSGQLSPEDLKKLIDEKKIKTVINLRGEHPGEKWYDQEFLLTEQLGINLVSIDMFVGQIPHKRSLLYLLENLRDAERPILIHCDTGIERTGEVAALYQMIYLRKTKTESMDMLSKKYGYAPGKTDPSKQYFVSKLWVDETWAIKDYDPCKTKYDFYDQNNVECTSKKQ